MSASSPSSSATTTTSPRSSTTPSPASASWPAATPSAPPSSFSPGRLAQVGIDAGKPILDSISGLMGFVSFFDNFIQIIILLIAWLIVVISFFIMAIQLFVSLIEFKLTTLAGFVLVPFGLFGRTAFLAEKVLGNVFSSGVKVLVLAVIVGIGSTIFRPVHQRLQQSAHHRRRAYSDSGGPGTTWPLDLRRRHRQWPDRRWPAARRRCGDRHGPRRRRWHDCSRCCNHRGHRRCRPRDWRCGRGRGCRRGWRHCRLPCRRRQRCRWSGRGCCDEPAAPRRGGVGRALRGRRAGRNVHWFFSPIECVQRRPGSRPSRVGNAHEAPPDHASRRLRGSSRRALR